MEPIDTKTKLLDVAEKLYAEKGIHATSLRNIIAEAGVNLAAIHYHFGSKEVLIRAVFARRIEPINAERLSRLDQLEEEAAAEAPQLEDLVRAFIEPAIRIKFDMPERMKFVRRLIAQLQSDNGELQEQFADLFEETARRFLTAFARALPLVPARALFWRFRFMLGAMFMIMAQPTLPVKQMFEAESEPEDIMNQILPFLVAGLEAPAVNKSKEDTTS